MRNQLWPIVRRFGFDALVVAGAVIAVAELDAARGEFDGPDASLPTIVVCVLAIALPLLARRRFASAGPAASLVAGAATSFVEPELVPFSGALFLTVLAAVFLLGTSRERTHSVAGLVLGYALIGAVMLNTPATETAGEAIFIPALLTTVWLAGVALGHKLEYARRAEERAAQAERERETRARQAVEAERARIARELHDVVAHSVSVMTVQAGAVRRLLRADQERERQALEAVETTGRQTLNEMRRLLGILRQAEGTDGDAPELAPQPGIDSLERLVREVRTSGMPVDLKIEGERYPVAPAVDIAVYRVVQEALTNALRDAGPTRAEVVLRYGDGRLDLEVANDGRSDQNGDGDGYGLEGMRERIAFCGGTLDAGPRNGGGFVIHANIPLPKEGAPV